MVRGAAIHSVTIAFFFKNKKKKERENNLLYIYRTLLKCISTPGSRKGLRICTVFLFKLICVYVYIYIDFFPPGFIVTSFKNRTTGFVGTYDLFWSAGGGKQMHQRVVMRCGVTGASGRGRSSSSKMVNVHCPYG